MEVVRNAILAAIGLMLAAGTWVLIDARRRRVPTRGNTYKADTGALAWFLGCLLLWPVVFPMYLARRKLWGWRQKQAAAFSEAEEQARRGADAPGEAHAANSEAAAPRDYSAIVAAQRLGRFDSVQLAPNFPARLLRDLTVSPIELDPGELLLAVVDPTRRMQTKRRWAVTTRRVVSCDARNGNPSESAAEALKTCENKLGPALADAIGQFLGVIGDTNGAANQGHLSLPRHLANFAAGLLPALADQSEQIRTEHRAVCEFRAALRVETPYVFVTPAILLACLGVFLAMIRGGVSAVSPDVLSLIDWGAMFGLRVALDHEYWRLFTAMFLHVGIAHLLCNMIYLAWLGPTIERFFGNLAFAAIYLLSGLGGALASMAVHPTLAAAGASGAIFGVFGAIVGLLAAQRRSVPRVILTPLLIAALAFITGSLIAGIFEPRIDVAAHLGGLATGLACGLLLWRRIPAVPGRRGVVRRLAVVSAVCLAMAVATRVVSHAVAGVPEAVRIVKQRQADSYNRLAESIQLLMMRYAVMRYQVERVLLSGDFRRDPFENYLPIEHSAETVAGFRALSTEHAELRPILNAVVTAADEIGGAAGMIKKALDAADTHLPKSHPSRWKEVDHQWLQKLWDDAEKTLHAKFDAGTLAMDRAVDLRDQYLREHGFEDCLASLEGVRRQFHEEEARMRERMGLKSTDRLPQHELQRRQFRQWMSDWELKMLEVAWSLRAAQAEPTGKAASRDPR